MYLAVISDIHGRFDDYIKTIEYLDKKYNNDIITLQLGDLGMGFQAWSQKDQRMNALTFPEQNDRHVFIVGNHDSRAYANTHPNYLGDFGCFTQEDGVKIFVHGGANTPLFDKNHRTEGVDWFADEELTLKESIESYNAYIGIMPDILVSHDTSHSIRQELFGIQNHTRTSDFLDLMMEAHKPKIHVFGHHHKYINKDFNGVNIQCRPELGITLINLKNLEVSTEHVS